MSDCMVSEASILWRLRLPLDTEKCRSECNRCWSFYGRETLEVPAASTFELSRARWQHEGSPMLPDEIPPCKAQQVHDGRTDRDNVPGGALRESVLFYTMARFSSTSVAVHQ